MEFYLKCWVPSLKKYVKISELKMAQLDVLSKFILNEDHEGTGEAFEKIIEENLQDKEMFSQLNKFDKWFILCFLRAANISPIVYIQTTTVSGAPCNVELDLFDTLTKLSEVEPVFDPLNVQDLVFKFKVPSRLYTVIPGFEALETVDNVQLPSSNLLTENISLYELINTFLKTQDTKLDTFYLIKNDNTLVNVSSVTLKLFDNTLFFYTRSIYLPFCKGQYSKRYKLLKHIGLDYKSISQLTPAECDIFVNQYVAEDAEKKAKKNADNR